METTFSKQDTLVVKGVAICCMLLHHCFMKAERFEGFEVAFSPFSQESVIAVAQLGKSCVGLFVFLSAYGMACSLLKQENISAASATHFVLRRLINLLSGFFAAYVVSVAGCALFSPERLLNYSSDSIGSSIFYVLCDGLGLSALFDTPTLIHTWWYMGFAIVLILVFPLLIKLYRKIGILLMPLGVLLPCVLGMSITQMNRWMMLLPALGIVCADCHVLERCKNWCIVKNTLINGFIRFVFLSGGIAVYLYWLIHSGLWGYDNLTYVNIVLDAGAAFLIALWSYLFLADCPVIREIFQFLGKHSMNIYLIHSFIRGVWFYNQLYSMGHFMIIFLTLLGSSLVISVLLELLKKYSGYTTLVQKLQRQLQN
jgi:peptidoglycan/LPS O-acetylase OafA/YrhL